MPEKSYYNVHEVREILIGKTKKIVSFQQLSEYIVAGEFEVFLRKDDNSDYFSLSEHLHEIQSPAVSTAFNFLFLSKPTPKFLEHCPLKKTIGGGMSEFYVKPVKYLSSYDIFISTKSLHDFERKYGLSGQPKIETMLIDALPIELQTAFAVYYEFWHEKPKDMNPTLKEDIAQFISLKMGRKVKYTEELFKRVDSIAKPDKAKKGGAPKSDFKTYKGKSKENH